MKDYKKKYEDLITSLKKAKDDETVCDDRFCVVIDNIVSELKESEDEKIRKELIGALKQLDREKTPVDTYPYFEWVAWLEKQGERKPTWSKEDETALGDALWCIEQARKQAKNENDMGTCWFAERWLKSLKHHKTKQEWSEEDEKIMLTIISDGVRKVGLDESQINWLKSLKERVLPKVELTQLDKNILEAAIAFVEQNNQFNCWRGVDKHTVLSALHSLKPKNTWKPSEEQMEALRIAYEVGTANESWAMGKLKTLYNDLKAL